MRGLTETQLAAHPARPDLRLHLPNTVTALRRGDEGGDEELIPLLRGRTAREGRATAYVCERFACRQPVTNPDALAAQLGLASA